MAKAFCFSNRQRGFDSNSGYFSPRFATLEWQQNFRFCLREFDSRPRYMYHKRVRRHAQIPLQENGELIVRAITVLMVGQNRDYQSGLELD